MESTKTLIFGQGMKHSFLFLYFSGSIMADIVQLQLFLSLAFEITVEGVHLHLKEIFQKQVMLLCFFQNLAWGKIGQNFKHPYLANSWSHAFHASMIRSNSEKFIEI